MTDAKPYTLAEASILTAYHGAPATKCPLDDNRFYATVEALERAEAEVARLNQAGRANTDAFITEKRNAADGHALLMKSIVELKARAERAEATLAAVTAERDRMHGLATEAMRIVDNFHCGNCDQLPVKASARYVNEQDDATEKVRAALASTPAPAPMPLVEMSPVFACGRCAECDGGRGSEFCVFPRGGHPRVAVVKGVK